MKTKQQQKEEMKKDKKIILWEVNSFPAIEIQDILKKNLSEEDKDMIVNEISLVIQNIILQTTGSEIFKLGIINSL